MLLPFFATFGVVFLAEIVGDKLLYTTGVLATRYASAPIIWGVSLAVMAKMGVAVMVGEAIGHLSPYLVAAISGASFLGVAYAIWRTPDTQHSVTKLRQPAAKVALVSFAAVFFSEWGDVGQITAATMAAQYRAPFSVWLGAVCAMTTKGALAATLGAGARRWLRDRVPAWALKAAATGAILVLAVVSIVETLGRVSGRPEP
jgi:putative Ca2+/H+ antiporter (TMEM165/GDT1 family)